MKLAAFILLSLLGEGVVARQYCGGRDAAVCPDHHTCIDLPDNCHPEQGDMYCEGVCYLQGYHTAHSVAAHSDSKDVFTCGGSVHRSCPFGFRCVDLPDKCDPSKGMQNCDGVCYPESQAAHMSSLMGSLHPHNAASHASTKPASHLPAHHTSHVTHQTARHELVHCGGHAMLKCPSGYACVDVPDHCNPLHGDVNCPGVCYLSAAPAVEDALHQEVHPLTTSPAGSVQTPMPHNAQGQISMCGGVHNLKCTVGFTCVDLPDDCHPNLHQPNCPGVCYPHTGLEHHAGAGLKAATVAGHHYSVTPQLSALKEYQSEALVYCHNKKDWTHDKALWCCQHEKLGCPSPAHVVVHPVVNTSANVAHHHKKPAVVAQVPKACLYNQCPIGTTTCVPDPHHCSNPHAHCFQYKCEPVGSDPVHKVDATASSKEGCAIFTSCGTCTKKYNWQGEQCAWCTTTGKCHEQSKQLKGCMAGARLYPNECPTKAHSGAKHGAHNTAEAAAHHHAASVVSATKAAHDAHAAKLAASHSASHKVHLAPHQGTPGPVGPRGPPGVQPVDKNVHAAIAACSGKVPGKSHCEFHLTSGALVKGICWHNAGAKGVGYCSKKFLERVVHWVGAYKACKPELAGAGCKYVSSEGHHVVGKCVPHNFLGKPHHFNAFVQKSMGHNSLLHFHSLQKQLFADEDEIDHFDDEDFEEKEKDSHYHHDILTLLDQADSLSGKRSLLSTDDEEGHMATSHPAGHPGGHKGALLFCASQTSHDVPLWHHALQSCHGAYLGRTCSFSAVQGQTKHGRCVNGNSGSLAKNAHRVKTLYCRAHEVPTHHH
mmetsp:Transcript_1989/g.2666  ORF Transcript_1989/g.2666 Transcript_1989/m.2666 type:complete len:822 (-) Transcript_1989:408-2873(-)|eukprot:CAMPEP_0175088980 /NCGR_PEP_ID=MMETSP0086_2-20121207/544_1 /TAXON_ID=136419 /ORGANISM="Unknown Unknown, Strain D1" /LENGTH=821 /DNA_ID=CAMNT_0016361463 /DNA_START=65 /DNA_END=2530 /DNA_ORIENTATION=+